MPAIHSSADLRNNYNDISGFCHSYREPVYITKNGKGDLAVMSIEHYEEISERYKLYDEILLGLEDIKNDKTRPFAAAMADLRKSRKR